MQDMRLGVVETQFAQLVWDHAPMSTKALVALCEEQLNWKRTTTYTVLKKFCDRGIFAMENRQVTVLISREAFYAMQSEQFVADGFGGSLPAFIAAFATRKSLSAKELGEIKALLTELEEGTV